MSRKRTAGRLLCCVLLCGWFGGCASSTRLWTEDPLEQAKQRLLDNPRDVRNHLGLAELYAQRHDYLRAQQYLSLVDNAAGAWSTLGIDPDKVFRLAVTVAVRSQQYSDAVRRCRQRLELGEDRSVRELYATLLEALGEELAAERQRRLLVLHHPEDARQLVELARFLERGSRADKRQRAREYYERYLALRPEGPEAPAVRQALRAVAFEADLAEQPKE